MDYEGTPNDIAEVLDKKALIRNHLRYLELRHRRYVG